MQIIKCIKRKERKNVGSEPSCKTKKVLHKKGILDDELIAVNDIF